MAKRAFQARRCRRIAEYSIHCLIPFQEYRRGRLDIAAYARELEQYAEICEADP